ncbi:MAG TPA: 2-phospho-L-lactate guanylyltransferase [Solirubrobacteraceae bacterium]|jgi:2-phospho-L-lactate guanylyltransferase|nr:2-phospho-L-lactate guanylyltransferase [Solirubrobacteraceae bacterium]
MRTAAILPVKRFSAAKSRLGASGVAETLRQRLARAMVTDVLHALAQTDSIERTIVVTREPTLVELAAEHGALLLADTAEDGQSAAVALGVQRALADGIERVLCIPGDCPALDPAELDALLAAADERADRDDASAEVTIVPDRHGAGTNGLLLTPPDAIEPAFGPDSCARHAALANDAGARCQVEHPASLLLDIDTGADLAALQDRLGATRAAAVRTRAVLGQPERNQIISVNSD